MTIGTINLDLHRLAEHPEAGLIMSIFHAWNDLQCVAILNNPSLRSDEERLGQVLFGISLYYMRLTCAHISECLKLLPLIAGSTYLRAFIRNDERADQSLGYLVEFTPEGAHKSDFKKFKKIRHKLTFHYNVSDLRNWYQTEMRESAIEGTIYVPPDGSALPTRYGFVDSLNTRILSKHVLELDGAREPASDEQSAVLEAALRITLGPSERLMHAFDAITFGVMQDYRMVRPCE